MSPDGPHQGPHVVGNRTHTFILRLWFESGKELDQEGEWRGEIRDVTTRSTAHFRHIDGLTAAIRELGLPGT